MVYLQATNWGINKKNAGIASDLGLSLSLVSLGQILAGWCVSKVEHVSSHLRETKCKKFKRGSERQINKSTCLCPISQEEINIAEAEKLMAGMHSEICQLCPWTEPAKAHPAYYFLHLG